MAPIVGCAPARCSSKYIVREFGGTDNGRSVTLAETTMSLPPEILDLIVDHLHNEPIALKACCVVSKSWVPRSRRFIFARVEFDSVRSSIGLWTKAFPDPPNSPAHFTRSLRIHSLGVVSANVCTWIRSFFHIEELVVNTFGWGGPYGISPVQLHGLSPTLKSLHLSRVSTPMSEILDLVCSFPLLEDLSLHSETPESHTERWTTPPISPKLTGSLLLNGENRSIIRGLLGLPDGLRFSSIRVGCYVDDADSKMITELISKCSDTLESLYIGYYPLGASPLVCMADQSLTATRVPRSLCSARSA